MAKKKHTVRSYDNPDIGFEYPDGSTVKLFVLGENESIPTLLSTVYDHHYMGPGLVYERNGPQSRECSESYVNDKKTWEWIGSLIAEGLKGGAKMISTIQK